MPSIPNLTLSMEDVGTRLQHCTQLLDIWNGGLNILTLKSEASRSVREQQMIEQLIHATELLKKHMTGLHSDYDESSMRKVIDSLPKNAEDIKD